MEAREGLCNCAGSPEPLLLACRDSDQKFDLKPIGYISIGYISMGASSDFCLLLKTFANSLDPDQDWKNLSPDLDQNHLTLF